MDLYPSWLVLEGITLNKIVLRNGRDIDTKILISVLSKLEENNVQAIENFWSERRKRLLVSIELRANKWPTTMLKFY